MAVVVVSRWKGDPQNMKIFREGAPNLKRHGAVSARVGQCWAGPYAGQIYWAITFPDWATFGRAQQALAADAQWQKLYGEALKIGELQDRSVIVAEEL